MKEIYLKPCPFCGVRPEGVHDYFNGHGEFVFGVACTSSECKMELFTDTDGTREEAAKAWNTRAALTPPDGDQLRESEKDVALAQAVEFAEYVERQAKGAMVDAAKRFLSLPYAQELAKRIAPAEGYVLVPVELTHEMHCAFVEQWFTKVRPIDDTGMEDCYAAMLAARPEVPNDK